MKRLLYLCLVCACVVAGATAQSKILPEDMPKDPKAQKSYAEGVEWLKGKDRLAALASFRKADKQDGGQCVACRKQIIRLGVEIGDFKAADDAAQEAIAEAKGPKAVAMAHDDRAALLMREGATKNKPEIFA